MGGELQDGRVPQVRTILQPGDLGQHLAQRRSRIEPTLGNRLQAQRHRAQDLGQRRQVVPGVRGDGRPASLDSAEALQAHVVDIADRHRCADQRPTGDGAFDQFEAGVHAEMLSSSTVAASSTSRTTAVGVQVARVASGWNCRYRDASSICWRYSVNAGSRTRSSGGSWSEVRWQVRVQPDRLDTGQVGPEHVVQQQVANVSDQTRHQSKDARIGLREASHVGREHRLEQLGHPQPLEHGPLEAVVAVGDGHQAQPGALQPLQSEPRAGEQGDRIVDQAGLTHDARQVRHGLAAKAVAHPVVDGLPVPGADEVARAQAPVVLVADRLPDVALTFLRREMDQGHATADVLRDTRAKLTVERPAHDHAVQVEADDPRIATVSCQKGSIHP